MADCKSKLLLELITKSTFENSGTFGRSFDSPWCTQDSERQILRKKKNIVVNDKVSFKDRTKRDKKVAHPPGPK